jgi:hypothetical protein
MTRLRYLIFYLSCLDLFRFPLIHLWIGQIYIICKQYASILQEKFVISMNLSERLKHLIDSKGIKPYEIFKVTGISQSTLSRKRRPLFPKENIST